MKKYIKLFLLLFTFITVHTIAMADDLADHTTMECKVKTSSVDSEENSKDFKVDLFVSSHTPATLLKIKKLRLSASFAYADAYLKSPFKPPRA